MGLLQGDLAKKVYTAFKGKLLTGLIRQPVIATSGGLDEHGDPIDAGFLDTAFEGFFEDYSDYYRAQAGIPETDVKINILAQSCPGIAPQKDDKVKLLNPGTGANGWYQLRNAGTDPATAMWTCRAYPIPDQE